MKFTNEMIEKIADKVRELVTTNNETWDDLQSLKKRVAELEKCELERQAHEVTECRKGDR